MTTSTTLRISLCAPLLLACSGGGSGYYFTPNSDGGASDLTIFSGDLAGHQPSDFATTQRDFSLGASCNDGMKDGQETDIDCGGPMCARCGDGQHCNFNTDCQTAMCSGGICQAAASCNDGMTDGSETDIDCGGPQCPACGDGSACLVNGDCTSAMCGGGLCQGAASCNDGIKNGQETDVDCGGPMCSPCGDGLSGKVRNDCSSQSCSIGLCCATGTANCDGNKGNGCEVDLTRDAQNCGACGHRCPNGESCSNSQCVNGGQTYTFSGVKNNLPVAALTGWTICYQDTYDASVTPVATILQSCTGSSLLLACRPNNSQTLTVAAMAPRADVLFDTAQTQVPHNANGVGWYFNDSYSWGFAAENDSISRNTCDTDMTDPGNRLCWHTSAGHIDGGYRCGATTGLNNYATWDRIVFQSN